MAIPESKETQDRLEIVLANLPPRMKFQIDPSKKQARLLNHARLAGSGACSMLWMVTAYKMELDSSVTPAFPDLAKICIFGLLIFLGLIGFSKFIGWLFPVKFEFSCTYAVLTSGFFRKIKVDPGAMLVICSHKDGWWKIYSSHTPRRWRRVNKTCFPELPRDVENLVTMIRQKQMNNADSFI